MKIIKEKDDYDLNDIVLIEFLTYYKLKFLTDDWILRIKAKIENLKIKIYLWL